MNFRAAKLSSAPKSSEGLSVSLLLLHLLPLLPPSKDVLKRFLQGGAAMLLSWVIQTPAIFSPPQTFVRRPYSQDFEGEENDEQE